MEKSVSIIGAGLAGLSTGVFAQLNGYRCHIFEHHTQAGGVAAAWRRDGYLIDGGIHFLMGHTQGSPTYELYRQVGAAEAMRVVDLSTYVRYVDEQSGVSIDITRDLARLARDLKALSPVDAPIVDEIIAGARALGKVGFDDTAFAKPPELTRVMDQVRLMWAMRGVYKYMRGRFARPVIEYARSIQGPLLRRIVENLFLPEVPVWFVLSLLGMLADGQLGLLQDGVRGFVQPIEARFKSLGGQITYGAKVEQVLVEDNRAVGVRLEDGSRHHSDFVVSGADGRSAVFGLLGGRYMDSATKTRFDTWKLYRPMAMISFGVARQFPDEPALSGLFLKQPFRVGPRVIDGILVRLFNYGDRFSPPGKTVVQVEFETDWDYWCGLRDDQPRYQAEKERLASIALEHLEEHFPGITRQVEITDVATPYTTWRYTLNHHGSPEGWLPTPEVITTTIRRTLPGLDGFYMAGQWVMPGGGVPPCIYSGRHVAQLLCRRDGKRFIAEPTA